MGFVGSCVGEVLWDHHMMSDLSEHSIFFSFTRTDHPLHFQVSLSGWITTGEGHAKFIFNCSWLVSNLLASNIPLNVASRCVLDSGSSCFINAGTEWKSGENLCFCTGVVLMSTLIKNLALICRYLKNESSDVTIWNMKSISLK